MADTLLGRCYLETRLGGPMLVAVLALSSAHAQVFTEAWITSSYDGFSTRSVIMEPAGYDGTPRPLLITLHGMGGDAWSAINGYDTPANARGWLAASPDTHGELDMTGETSLAARAMQHDVLDLIDHVSAGWAVDADRVYITGGSMGGMGTTIMAAKYPERFAAAVDWFGPADLAQAWDELPWGNFRDNMRLEIGGSPTEEPLEYARRSPIYYARNLRHMPFAIGQGRLDFVVAPHHSEDLADAINSFAPTQFYGIYWNWGAHFMFPAEFDLTLSFLEGFTRAGDPPDLALRTDEDQTFWWLAVQGADPNRFRTVEAVPYPASNRLVLDTQNTAVVAVDVSRTVLSGAVPLTLELSQDTDTTVVLTGMPTGTVFAVTRGGVPWPSVTYTGLGLLELTVPLADAGTAPFLVQ